MVKIILIWLTNSRQVIQVIEELILIKNIIDNKAYRNLG